jgi:ribosomal protein L15
MRIPKLRGFKNRFKVDYEVVNIGAIAAAAERGAFEGGEMPGAASKPKKAAPVTVNQELLRAVGLVRTLKKPLKILGDGELSTALFVVADAFTKTAVAKIEGAGGTISILEVPTEELVALGTDGSPREAREPRTAAGRLAAGKRAEARVARATDAAEKVSEAQATSAAKAAKPPKASKPEKSSDVAESPVAEATVDATAAVVADSSSADSSASEPTADAGASGAAESSEDTASTETDAADDENA